MPDIINSFINHIESKGLKPDINLDRPIYVQPEDRISYRAYRILIILGMLNTQNGLSKEVIASLDFLLRNTGYQKDFILQYFKGQGNIIKKITQYNLGFSIENDRHIVQYKSVPWDLRFNDMFIFLYVRDLIEIKGIKPNLRLKLSEPGIIIFDKLQEIFPDEMNFLEMFGKRLNEEKTITIITEVIPNSYWRDNEKFNH